MCLLARQACRWAVNAEQVLKCTCKIWPHMAVSSSSSSSRLTFRLGAQDGDDSLPDNLLHSLQAHALLRRRLATRRSRPGKLHWSCKMSVRWHRRRCSSLRSPGQPVQQGPAPLGLVHAGKALHVQPRMHQVRLAAGLASCTEGLPATQHQQVCTRCSATSKWQKLLL